MDDLVQSRRGLSKIICPNEHTIMEEQIGKEDLVKECLKENE